MNKILSFLMIPSIVVSSLLIFNTPAEAGGKPGMPRRTKGAGSRLVDKDSILRSQQLNYVITDYGVFTLS